MATLTKAAFLAKYEAIFADNTSGDISEQDMRDFRQDIADSFILSGGLNWVTVEIGDWDMDATATVDIDLSTSGITDGESIRVLCVSIRRDDLLGDFNSYQFPMIDSSGNIDGWSERFIDEVGTDRILRLHRRAGGTFDNTSYDSTSYNRGWITIGYV